MTYRITAKATSISDALKVEQIKWRMAQLKGITRAGDMLKETLRDQITAAGLSPRLAKTWQEKIYDNANRSNQGPAAYIYSKAPKIIDAFARGASIVATNGRRCLAIPNENTPRQRQGHAKTPKEVEAQFGRKLRFVPATTAQGSRLGTAAVGYLVMDGVVARKETGRFRKASASELGGNGKTKGRRVDFVVMFTLVPRVKMPKLFDLQATAESVGATVPQLIAEEWS